MWTDGFVGEFYYWAKVFDEPSRFGISNGRVSKLTICDKNGNLLCLYDRGWVEEPADDAVKEAISEILDLYRPF